MAQRESVPKDYDISLANDSTGFTCRSKHRDANFDYTFEIIRPNVFRTTFTSLTHPLPPYPNAEKPAVKLHGQKPVLKQDGSVIGISIGDIGIACDVSAAPLLSVGFSDSPVPLHEDLPFRSYAVEGSGASHYTKYDRSALHLGLGEKAAPMDLTGRSFRISATDSFGYDIYKTDPLYKHIPLLITARPEGCVAMFSTSHARGSWHIGSEMDGLWGRYKVYRQDYGGLEEYLIIGKTLQHVVHGYAEIVGFPLRVPRWSFGYIAGGYRYTMMDNPRACDALMEFADKVQQHDIPCSAMQLSSGYHVAHDPPKVRNVFHWNRHRFPDPAGFTAAYHKRGIRLIANAKPYLLESHPDFKKLLDSGAFFTDPETGGPGYMRLWSAGGGESGLGCHLDFTCKAAFDWWRDRVTQLSKEGIDVPWNDNNEYTIPRDDWECRLDAPEVQARRSITTSKSIGLWGRAMHTELMAKASHDGLVAADPRRRPFVLTRSATPGTMRYACSSWSGDNVTSWEGMRGSNALSLNAGISLLQCSGHDIGGFEGPQPSPELLVRWVQLGAHSPRFAINCFKTSAEDNLLGEVIEPWMYPEVTHLVRAAIKRRYELMPYIYSLSLYSVLSAIPPQRWVGWGYEDNSEVWESRLLRDGENQYWLGDYLMIAGVFEPGADTARLYLPKSEDRFNDGFINVNHPFQHLPAGGWVDIESRWDTSIAVLALVGGCIPVGKAVQTKSVGETNDPPDLPLDDWRGLEIYPPPGTGASETQPYRAEWLEDDGISIDSTICRYTVEYFSTDETVYFKAEKAPVAYEPDWQTLEVIMPHGDEREVCGLGSAVMTSRHRREDGRNGFIFSVTLAQESSAA